MYVWKFEESRFTYVSLLLQFLSSANEVICLNVVL